MTGVQTCALPILLFLFPSHDKKGTRKAQGKKVLQIDITSGKVIKEFEVLSDAIREYGWSIAPCVRGKTKTAYNYAWKYSN